MPFVASDRVLLLFTHDMISGDTRLHALGFLLARQHEKETSRIAQKMQLSGFYDDWEPQWFNPYSKALAKDIDDCLDRGLLYKRQSNEIGIPFVYGLTHAGRKRYHIVLKRKLGSDMLLTEERIEHLQKVDIYSILEDLYVCCPEYMVRD